MKRLSFLLVMIALTFSVPVGAGEQTTKDHKCCDKCTKDKHCDHKADKKKS